MLAFVNGMDAAVVTRLCCVMEQQHQQQHLQADAFVLRVALVLIAIHEVRWLLSIHPTDPSKYSTELGNQLRLLHS